MRASRVLLICLGSLAALCVAASLTVHFAVSGRVGAMKRLPDPFASLAPSRRPQPEPALTVLLAGVDSGLYSSATGTSGHSGHYGRSDALMLVRLTADRKQAYVISLPRDSWIPIPGRGHDKLNAALAIDGPGLTVQTVEQLTGIHIDHVAIIDMAGFRALIDAVGGVTIESQRLDGRAALAYVRERQTLPRGDLDRVLRQQHFMRALFEQVGSEETLSSPRRMLAVFDAIAETTTVDHGFGIRTMAGLLMDFRRLNGNVRFLTTPIKGTGRVGDASVVFLDPDLGPLFWDAVARDDLDGYLAVHRTDVPD